MLVRQPLRALVASGFLFPRHRFDQSRQDLVHGISVGEDFGYVEIQRDDFTG